MRQGRLEGSYFRCGGPSEPTLKYPVLDLEVHLVAQTAESGLHGQIPETG